MIQFWNGGVGHKSTWEATDSFKKDLDLLDMKSDIKCDDEAMPEVLELQLQAGKKERCGGSYGYATAINSNSEMDYNEAMLCNGNNLADGYFGPD
jgi:hypothetical protein